MHRMGATLTAMKVTDWKAGFREVYERARQAYLEGAGSPQTCIEEGDRAFLAECGCSAQELFDLVEDDVTVGEPGFDRALRITEVRREYFLKVDQGKPPERLRRASEFPSPGETLGGLEWLPRILAKARAKLRGELPPELMYCCGGDRPFLSAHGLDPDGFLRAVWRADDREEEVVSYVKNRGSL